MELAYTEVFEQWIRELRDQRARASILSRLRRIEEGNFGDHVSVGGGISELRINVGPGYRVYYTIRQNRVVILICGGNKSSQQRDIRQAQRMVSEI
jgi:putative addiction module killer protein